MTPTKRRPKRKSRPGVDRAGRTPLHYAACDGDLGAARQLLRESADPSARDDNGWTPLHFAAQGSHFAIAEELVARGADIDAVDEHGHTPLSTAVFNSRGRGDLIALFRANGRPAQTQPAWRFTTRPCPDHRQLRCGAVLQRLAIDWSAT